MRTVHYYDPKSSDGAACRNRSNNQDVTRVPESVTCEACLEAEFKKRKKEVKCGEAALFRQGAADPWFERIFVAEIKGAEFPFIAVDCGDEESFAKRIPFKTTFWKSMVPVYSKEK